MRYRRLRDGGSTYFFTVVSAHRKPILAPAVAIECFKAAVANVGARHPFKIDAEVILPDHVHSLWTLPEGDNDYSTRWMLIKCEFTRNYRKRLASGESDMKRRKSPFWQDRFWEHLVRDERDFIAHLDYIHINPVKHGLVKAASDWPHSTFREFVDRGVCDLNWGSGRIPDLPEWVGNE